jgi:hypothetical protein
MSVAHDLWSLRPTPSPYGRRRRPKQLTPATLGCQSTRRGGLVGDRSLSSGRGSVQRGPRLMFQAGYHTARNRQHHAKGLDKASECSTFVLMEVETLGVARSLGWRVHMRCADGYREGHEIHAALRLSSPA